MRTAPTDRLPREAVTTWRIGIALFSTTLLALPLFLWIVTLETDMPSWIIYTLAIAIVLIMTLWGFLVPEIRWRRWRYQIDEEEIDLQRGVIIITRTLVPVKRIQHVDTRQGPILRRFGLSDVTISTAATTHRIPALTDETAEEVRDQISRYVRLAREDV